MRNISIVLSLAFLSFHNYGQQVNQEESRPSKEEASLYPSDRKQNVTKTAQVQFFSSKSKGSLQLIESGDSLKLEFDAKDIPKGKYQIVNEKVCRISPKGAEKLTPAKNIRADDEMISFDVGSGESYYFEGKLREFSFEAGQGKKALGGSVAIYLRKKKGLMKLGCAELNASLSPVADGE